ncbi:DUF4214 domain-containing protein [Massilia niastensis]|uniref:DUF4214 domain-containing protein n=1 Tax=Massilia niastensis TaxID=544911 RepID=UPI00039E8510|nr:DUF4214 domain-containing protein [Massilia niastensis]
MAIVTAHVAAVQQLYVAYFNRPADVAGLDYWTNIVANNKGATAAVSATFSTSPEYTDLFKGLTNAQIVDKIYGNLFNQATRANDGRDYWVKLLDAGTIKVSTIVAEVAAGALTTDKEAVENKVAGATAFTTALDTQAEQAGYAGADALALAKAFITSITTDASLTAAIAPAALAATVAAVVAAGTEFTVVSGLAALEAAKDAVADFLGTLDLDDDAETDTTAGDVADALVDTEVAVEGEIGGTIDFSDASAAIQAALIADKTKALAAAVVTAEGNLADANEAVAEVEGLGDAIAAVASAAAAKKTVDAEVKAALADQQAALGSFNVIAGTSVTVAADGQVTGVIVKNATTGALQLATTVTAANRPAATALLEAVVAHQAALVEQATAADAVFAAKLDVHLLDESAAEVAARDALVALVSEDDVGAYDGVPTAAQILLQRDILVEEGSAGLAAFNTALNAYVALDIAANNPLSAAVATQTTALETANTNVEDLAEAVAAYEEAQANAEELAALNAAVTAATKAFADNDFKAPVFLGATAAGTAGADIFVFDGADATTITSFGRVGADSLFIGSDFTLNTGKLADGDNAKLEVFFVQTATGVKVTLETEVYGSDSAAVAEQTITLTGVDAEDLVLANGIISLKAPTA